MSNYKVFMTDSIFPDTKIEEEELSKIGAKLVLSSRKEPEVFISEGHDCDAMLVVYAQVGAEVINSLEKCKIIVRTGIGFNNIDLEAASEKKIMVANVPDYCQDEVADHTLALFLAGVRKIAYLNTKVKSGIWDVNEAKPIPRLSSKKYGIIGCGAIGLKVAQRAKSFGMEVYGYDPYLPDEKFQEEGIIKVSTLDEFYPLVDYFSLHVPLMDATHHMINLESMKKMKPEAFFVNTSRGPLVNEEDLYEALSQKMIAGAGLDVLNTEPPAQPFPLAKFDNVILTPHAAFVSEEAIPELRRKAAQEIVRTLTEGKPKYWVNARDFK